MRTREDILQTLASGKPEWSKKYKVLSMALFGSYAREEQGEGSDVDILVEVDPRIGLEFVSLAEEIERQLGIKVDLVSRRAMKPRHFQFISRDLVYV